MSNNNFQYPPLECNTRALQLEGQGRDYGKVEQRQALAIVDALNEFGVGISDLPAGNYFEISDTAELANKEILPAEPDRRLLVIQNLSQNNIFIRFGAVATSSNGFELCPKETLTSQVTQLITQSVNVIGEASSSNLYGFEIVA